MLELEVGGELFIADKNEFLTVKPQTLMLEHSLISISRWESKWKKPFHNPNKEEQKTPEEFIDYIRCMTINKNVDPNVYICLTSEDLDKIGKYIEDPMTATWFSNMDGENGNPRANREIITSEVVYYWMIKAGIPLECEKWHFNRLVTLIQVFGAKDGNQKKMGRNEILQRNAKLNAARRKKYNTKG